MRNVYAAFAIASVAGLASGQVYFSDFDSDGGGFTGTGDWELGTPLGVAGSDLGGSGGPEPFGGFSGSSVWGTVIGGLHSPSTVSTLSRTIDATGFTDLQLDFYEWLLSGLNTFDTAEVLVNGQVISLRDGGPTTNWRLVSLDLSAFDNTVFDLSFQFDTTAVVDRVGWYIDNVAVTGIPTPASAMLLGLGGIVCSRRRR
jgi:hypothetical protein